jgi:hypothetical protein
VKLIPVALGCEGVEPRAQIFQTVGRCGHEL